MIIHQDSLIVLLYEPKSDILSVKWPHLVNVPLPVIQHSFTKLIDSINHYRITKLLIDSKGTNTTLPEEDYQPIAMKLAMDLASTNLKKIARVISEDQLRENRSKEYGQKAQSRMSFNFKNKEFSDKYSALMWLASDEE